MTQTQKPATANTPPSPTLVVVSTGALSTLQDSGRPGGLRFGIPRSGPMDRLAHAAANVAVGNDAGATAIEVSPGGIALESCVPEVTLAVTGGGFEVAVDGTRHASWSLLQLHRGQRLRIRAGSWGSWAYVGVAGAVASRRWWGSTATHSIANLGGGALVAGQVLGLAANTAPRVLQAGPLRQANEAKPTTEVRVVIGPQDHHLLPVALERFVGQEFAVSGGYDRMGMRLDGPELPLVEALSIPSEPVVRGSVQVAGDGVATILLADHQTTGGYPKIATVISADLDRLVQHRPGDRLRFVAVTPAEAVAAFRHEAVTRETLLREVSAPGDDSLRHRLLTNNLIGGVFWDDVR